jgi:NAD(P)-dependent dehydrogenase (short-subunit alcohol dehydrogenase family)
MDIRLDGKVALVTGGASGIGRATALAFAQCGASVLVADLDEAGARGTVEEIQRCGAKARWLRTDVSSEADCARMVAAAVEAYSRLDVAFNNAGIMASYGEKLHESTEADWDRLMAVNLKGVFLCMKHELKQMLVQGGGAIVNTASAVGLIGTPNSVTYPAAKHGVVGLTRCAALQYARSGIRINAICPGLVETPITQRMREQEPGFDEKRANFVPMGRISSPEEIAQAVVWLSSGAASYVTGTSMLVDGGWVAR